MIEFIQKVEFEIVIIIIGISIFIYWSRQPETTPLTSVKFKGYAGGIALVLIGIVSILNKFNLW